MKFEDGRPVLVTSFNGSPVGPHTSVLGRTVVINEHVTELNKSGSAIFFGDSKIVQIEDSATKVLGLFNVISDSHSWENEQYVANLNLRLG